MSRIGKAYEARYRALLLRLRARKPEPGVERLLALANRRARSEKLPPVHGLSRTYEHLRSQVRRWEQRSGSSENRSSTAHEPFLCDAGLGGLANWIRAAGYDARWFPGIADAELLRQAHALHGTILTTDSLMMERGVLRDGIIPAFWLPPALNRHEQLALVIREFNLPIREPRCMRCGGELQSVNKELVRKRIPPKTWRWIDEYFVCDRCGKLFWRGTHWEKIHQHLSALER